VELEGQQEQQEPQEPQEPQQPAVDPRVALEIAAQQYGVTPEFLEGAVRLQDENRRVAEEFRRRQHEMELREAKAEAVLQSQQRFAPPQPTYDDLDPVTRKVLERLDRIDQREEQRQAEAKRREEHQFKIQQDAMALQSQYGAVMRGVPTQNQIDQDRFFAAMGELYPTTNGELPAGITPEKAVLNTAKFLGINVNGSGNTYGLPRPMQPRDPRAQFIVPTQGGAQPGPAQSAQDFATQRPGETPEQYFQRRVQAMKDAGYTTPSIPDGTKVSFG
jgi:hypothetical protein